MFLKVIDKYCLINVRKAQVREPSKRQSFTSFASIRLSTSKILTIICFVAPKEQKKCSVFFTYTFSLTCITSWSHKTIRAGTEVSGQARASIFTGWFTVCCRYRIMLFKKLPLRRRMDWLCFSKREMLIIDSEERTKGTYITFLTRTNNKNLIPTEHTESQRRWSSQRKET